MEVSRPAPFPLDNHANPRLSGIGKDSSQVFVISPLVLRPTSPVFSTAIIDELEALEEPIVCYFYFTLQKNDLHSLVTSLIFQLSFGSHRSPDILQGVHSGALGGLPTTASLIDTLKHIITTLEHPIHIVIDALDECDKSDWPALIQLLRHMAFAGIRLIFTSQPREQFETLRDSTVLVSLSDGDTLDDVRQDIQTFIDHLLPWEPDQKLYIKQQLMVASQGM